DGGSTGRLYTSGQQRATGSVGGAVDLFGRDIIFAAATADASGLVGGGSVRIGSKFPGQGPAAWNTETVTVTAASTIRADAQRAGTGGRVSIGAEEATV